MLSELGEKLEKLGDEAKLLKRHLPVSGIRGRAFEAVLMSQGDRWTVYVA